MCGVGRWEIHVRGSDTNCKARAWPQLTTAAAEQDSGGGEGRARGLGLWEERSANFQTVRVTWEETEMSRVRVWVGDRQKTTGRTFTWNLRFEEMKWIPAVIRPATFRETTQLANLHLRQGQPPRVGALSPVRTPRVSALEWRRDASLFAKKKAKLEDWWTFYFLGL